MEGKSSPLAGDQMNADLSVSSSSDCDHTSNELRKQNGVIDERTGMVDSIIKRQTILESLEKKKGLHKGEFADLDEQLLESIEPYITPELPPSPVLAAYVDKSETRKISFLHSVGVEDDNLGKFLTKNPFILTEDVQNLKARVHYLKAKKFKDDGIAQIINRAPFFLNFSIKRLDNKLGFFQRELSLTGEETRQLITRTPKLVTGRLDTVKRSIFSLKEQMRFSAKECKALVLSQPRVLQTGNDIIILLIPNQIHSSTISVQSSHVQAEFESSTHPVGRYKLLRTFDYLHNTVGITHTQFVQFPQVFRSSLPRIKERHQYLVKLERAQYDPTKPGYISLEALFKQPDEVFCKDVAKTSILEFNNFLKTL
ncbi:transcription termination factor 3, mitochondrial-like [Ptychodera flava]|uniref:transcription termination factor 3, mitochondrial-like n=1 Tax=Ptychodera flava TaxID=63121 RepID=UPI00396A16B9